MNTSPVVLEGAVVRLEPLERRHVPGLAAVGLDPAIWRWTHTAIGTDAEMAAYVEAALAEQAAGESIPMATLEKATGRVVGSTRFMSIVAAHRRVEIGATWIAPPWQRTAINTEAKYLMLRHAFEEWGCLRVELKTDALNERSRRAILRLGAVEEGTFRRHMVVQGGRLRDSVYYSIIADEWPTVKAGLRRLLHKTLGPSNTGGSHQFG